MKRVMVIADQVLVHVSTAYAYPYESVLEERAYTPPAHPSRILARINFDMDDNAEDAIYSR
jgi:fatty acyl-CoA reductase